MNVLLALVGLLVLVSLIRVVRLVARDGLGTNPPPRSHYEELGDWATQQLRR